MMQRDIHDIIIPPTLLRATDILTNTRPKLTIVDLVFGLKPRSRDYTLKSIQPTIHNGYKIYYTTQDTGQIWVETILK